MRANAEMEILSGITANPKDVFRILKMSDGGGYKAIARGDIATMRVGNKLLVLCAPLRERLGIPHPKVAA